MKMLFSGLVGGWWGVEGGLGWGGGKPMVGEIKIWWGRVYWFFFPGVGWMSKFSAGRRRHPPSL